jgi:prophage DNA circulation protein
MSWKDDLLPASFRGVEFHYQDTRRTGGGRRGPDHEFPGRDDCYPEDMGRKKIVHEITGYVLGDDYMSQRDALEEALDAKGAGTLIHPYRGSLEVIIRDVHVQEIRDEGRMARFQFEAVLSGGQPSPTSSTDTADDALDGADEADTQAQASFIEVWSTDGVSLGPAQLLLIQLQFAVLPLIGWPGVDTAALPPIVAPTVANVSSASSLALGISAFFAAYASACIVSVQPFDETLSSRGPDLAADPGYGLGALAAWGNTLNDAGGGQIAANQAALVALVEGSATIALARIYAQTEFLAQDDADKARDQLTGLIDGLSLTAADAGDDGAYKAWERLYQASSDDLTIRAKQVPATVTYTYGGALPVLLLAQRFYKDPARASELVARNAAPHPLFMPPTVRALAT